MSEEDNENITKWDSNFASTLIDHYLLPDINFNGHCLKENKIYIFKKSNKSIYFLHTKSPPPKKKKLNTHFTLDGCLFGFVKLTKNADLDKPKHRGYGIRSDSCWVYSLPDGRWGKVLLLLELIWAHMCILIMREKISYFLVKDQHKV